MSIQSAANPQGTQGSVLSSTTIGLQSHEGLIERVARETSATTAANLASLGAASNPLDGFTRLASNTGNSSAGLGADGSQFSRLASLGGLAGQANTIARAPSGVGSSAVDAFNRTPSSLIPVGLGGIDRVSSLVGNVAGVTASAAADDHGISSKSVSAPMSGLGYGVSYPGQASLPRSLGMPQAQMHGLPFGLFSGQPGQPGSTVTDGQSKHELKQHMMAHMPHIGVGQAPAGRVPEAWQRPMSGSGAAVDPSIFSRTGSGGFARAGSDGAQPPSGSGVMGHWDPASALAGGVPLPMDVWGMGMHNSPAAHHPSLHNFGFSHEHMALMPGMYGAHGLQMQMPPSMQSRASLDPQDGGKGKKGRGKKGSKSRQGDPDASARKKRRAEKDVDGAAGSGGEGDDDGQGVEKHNQFLWAKRMGHQNEPRWGLFKQGGSAGPAFLKLLEDLETDGVIERQFGTDLPEQLGGVSGWVVKEGMMPEWQRRRQAWFMEGKEGREFKPNSLYQIMRRLGFFPTMRSSRAGHGHDFEGSSVFRWDADRRYSQRRNSSKAHDSESPGAGGKGVAGSAIMNNMPFGMPVGMNNLPFGIGGMMAGMPGSMISGGVPMGSGTMTKPMMMNPNGAGMINGMPAGFVAAMQQQQQQQQQQQRKLT